MSHCHQGDAQKRVFAGTLKSEDQFKSQLKHFPKALVRLSTNLPGIYILCGYSAVISMNRKYFVFCTKKKIILKETISSLHKFCSALLRTNESCMHADSITVGLLATQWEKIDHFVTITAFQTY